MSWAKRTKDGLEKWATEEPPEDRSWADRLKDWFAGWLAWGLEIILDVVGTKAGPLFKPYIQKIEDTGAVPPELAKLLDEIKGPTGEVGALLANSAGNAIVGGAIGKLIDWLLRPLMVGLSYVPSFVIPSPGQLITLLLRQKIEPDQFDTLMRSHGIAGETLENFKELAQLRLDPATVITAWRRDKPTWEWLLKDLEDQGVDKARIEALKFAMLYYPSPAELVHWTAREVFEPDMIAKYGLGAGADKLKRDLFYKAGMDDEQIDNHWIAHWEHASWMQVVEMLHRGLITEEDVKEWFPLVEMAPYWADRLIDTAYTWPTRVDVRRWWDMRTIDEARLRELYSGMGYRGKNLDDYVLWTKVYTDFPSLMARWSKGWITEEDVRGELTALGMPAERVETMIQEKIKPEEAARVEEGKALTKTEIYKGVKQGFISREEGTELITDLGYNRAEAEYLLDINVAVLEGSPETYAEFKDLTTKYKIATGREAKPMPEELKEAANEVIRQTDEVASLDKSIEEEERLLVDEEIIPEAAKERLTELQVTRNRAVAELVRLQSEYDRLLAEWKHKAE